MLEGTVAYLVALWTVIAHGRIISSQSAKDSPAIDNFLRLCPPCLETSLRLQR
jgi:hypothetical protein